MNPILMRAVLEALAFAELSSDDAIDPDAAVTFMEGIAAMLQGLSPEDKAEFVAYTKRLAEEMAGKPGNDAMVEFLRQTPEALGLIDQD